jgi:cytochrome bd ubiquinol oxidase subunit I
MEYTAVDIARVQFAITTIFHMLWPLLSIGLSLLMVVMEVMWLRTGDEIYYRQVRYWSVLFILAFGIGVASGVPLEFQFGTNWSRFSAATGNIVGNLLAFEASMSFALEAAFLAVFIFGWNRVSRRMHLFSNIMVAFGASLSAFWIMAANSWMQTPAGAVLENGSITITNYMQATFNPDVPIAFTHIWVASIETTLFFVGGICAWYIIKNRNVDFFLRTFKVMVIIGIVVAPLQIFLGDASGLTVIKHQPAKAAAMEAHWVTNPPNTGAPWVVLAQPDHAKQNNSWQITVPYVLSILSTHSLKGQVIGLRDFPVEDQPPVTPPFWAFRVMVLLGFFMLFLVLWALWQWFRTRLRVETAPKYRTFWNLWLYAIPIGFLATECGWIVREVGRQPWLVYGIMRTSDGVSPVSTATAVTSLSLFIIIYLILLGVFIYFMGRIMKKGPDLSSPLPAYKKTDTDKDK